MKIVKDTTPGTHPRFSYDKIGVVTNVIDGKGSTMNLYTLKVLFEPCAEQIDELWLRPYSVDEATVRPKRKRSLREKNIVIAVRVKVRVRVRVRVRVKKYMRRLELS